MKKRFIIGTIFMLSIFCLGIEMREFYQTGIFVDEFNLSPSQVYGGDFALILQWIKLVSLGLITLLAGITLVIKNK